MRCLIVDDEVSNRRLCARMLQRLECKSLVLTDGDEVSRPTNCFNISHVVQCKMCTRGQWREGMRGVGGGFRLIIVIG